MRKTYSFLAALVCLLVLGTESAWGQEKSFTLGGTASDLTGTFSGITGGHASNTYTEISADLGNVSLSNKDTNANVDKGDFTPTAGTKAKYFKLGRNKTYILSYSNTDIKLTKLVVFGKANNSSEGAKTTITVSANTDEPTEMTIDTPANVVLTNDAAGTTLEFGINNYDSRGLQIKVGGNTDLESQALLNFTLCYEEVGSTSQSVEMSSINWVSFAPAMNVKIPEGVKAYYVSDMNSSSVTLTQVNTGETVEANTGLLLNGSGEVTFAKSDDKPIAMTNYLKGTQVDIPMTDKTGVDVYVLGCEYGNVGLYKYEGATLAAGKAYLEFGTGSAPRYFTLPTGEATGIEAVQGAESRVQSAEFNLAGQRVGTGYKGIVIKNGKKVMVK